MEVEYQLKRIFASYIKQDDRSFLSLLLRPVHSNHK
jgi:hypothetical protein